MKRIKRVFHVSELYLPIFQHAYESLECYKGPYLSQLQRPDNRKAGTLRNRLNVGQQI